MTSPKRLSLLLACLPPLYALLTGLLLQHVRPENLVLAIAAPLLALAGPRARAVLVGCLPLLVIVYAFDAVRLLRPWLVQAHDVLGCELRAVELKVFGVGADTTLNDYFAVHHAPFFDVLFAIPYSAFVYVAAAYAIWLCLTDRPRMHHFLWSMSVLYLIGCLMWLAVPAAPPWYIRAHGCEILIATPPNAAALLRVDQLLGIRYFQAFYSQGAAVFGAMPSLHCAFPVVSLLIVWKHAGWPLRALNMVYAAWMMAGSVYLDHHWILDGIAGWLAAIASVLLGRAIVRRIAAA